MTFNASEISTQDGNPIELYEIEVGTTVYYFTNRGNVDGFQFDGNDYLPIVIGRDQHRVDDDQPGSQLNLILPTNHPVTQDLTQSWVAATPEIDSTQVTIRKVHVDEGSVQPFWFGFISSVDYRKKGQETRIACNALSDKFTLQGPRFNWGTLCNNQHYDTLCTLARGAFTQVATVSSISVDGLTYTLDSLAAPTVRYNSGEFKKVGLADSRLIVARSGNDITVQYVIPSIVVGDSVEVIEGCEHNLTDCAAYSNEDNFGASPYTPPVNPVTKGLDAL